MLSVVCLQGSGMQFKAFHDLLTRKTQLLFFKSILVLHVNWGLSDCGLGPRLDRDTYLYHFHTLCGVLAGAWLAVQGTLYAA
jgi:hypothetical protein